GGRLRACVNRSPLAGLRPAQHRRTPTRGSHSSTDRLLECGALPSTTDENVFEELTGAPARAPVYVPSDAVFEDQARVVENCRIEVVGIVDDDQHRATGIHLAPRVLERAAHRLDVVADRSAPASMRCRADLLWAAIDQPQKLVRVAVLFVI